METYYYLYRITNLINGKIYVGVHKTNDLDDGYMGSGLLIQRAIEKYGIENFEKIILQYFNSSEEMFEAESQVVNEDFVANIATYNLKHGGEGSWDFVNANISDAQKHLRAVNGAKAVDFGHIFQGKHHNEESKRRIGEASSKHQSGKGNSQYGKVWVMNGQTSKLIPKEDLNEHLNSGWIRGRKIK